MAERMASVVAIVIIPDDTVIVIHGEEERPRAEHEYSYPDWGAQCGDDSDDDGVGEGEDAGGGVLGSGKRLASVVHGWFLSVLLAVGDLDAAGDARDVLTEVPALGAFTVCNGNGGVPEKGGGDDGGAVEVGVVETGLPFERLEDVHVSVPFGLVRLSVPGESPPGLPGL